MTTAIGKLFGWSPFRLLQRHMGQVGKCLIKMCDSLDAFERGAFKSGFPPLGRDTPLLTDTPTRR